MERAQYQMTILLLLFIITYYNNCRRLVVKNGCLIDEPLATDKPASRHSCIKYQEFLRVYLRVNVSLKFILNLNVE